MHSGLSVKFYWVKDKIVYLISNIRDILKGKFHENSEEFISISLNSFYVGILRRQYHTVCPHGLQVSLIM